LNKRDLERFKKLLLEQREQLQGNQRKALGGDIHLDPDDFPDEIDTASSEINLQFTGRLREREQGLLSKVDTALRKIADGEYGECVNCGEDIGVKRLRARPVAELCIDCKSEQEKLATRWPRRSCAAAWRFCPASFEARSRFTSPMGASFPNSPRATTSEAFPRW
jgi:DnaK suppressor protein